MAVIIPPGYAQIVVPHLLTGYTREALCIWGVEFNTAPGDYVGWADEFLGIYIGSIGAQIDSQVTIGPVRLIVGQDGGDPLTYVGEATAVGGAARDSITPALAAMFSKNTTTGGRRGRGRSFVPWSVSDTNVTENGTLQPAARTALQAAANSFLDGVATLLATPVVLHGTGISAPPEPSPIGSLTVNGIIRTQKQRQVR